VILPKIEFSLKYELATTKKQRDLVVFVINSVVREYHRKLLPFGGFETHPVTIKVRTQEEQGKFQLTNFDTDVITLGFPTVFSYFHFKGYTYTISHELAHHIIQEYFGDNIESNYLGVNLVHYEENLNGGEYRYTKKYWSPRFLIKYGMPFVEITLLDVKKLIDHRDLIMKKIKDGTAPKGKGDYSII
jgi:hypothetical protein